MNSIYIALFHSGTECSKRFTIQYYPRQTWYQSETHGSIQSGSLLGAQRLVILQYHALSISGTLFAAGGTRKKFRRF